MTCESKNSICRDCPGRGIFDVMRSSGLNYQDAIAYTQANACRSFSPNPSYIFDKPGGRLIAINIEGSIFPPNGKIK